ncbi:Hypothetical predicted protein [Pelobates cultripes]|uniref:Uncharacterized protein n=1 Tax=Pelobates cultripes TaxID=61616 RepID=A0AAD1SUL1_PELCU|nr:Hypothetical predicted protein [Pelobates cultripes]
MAAQQGPKRGNTGNHTHAHPLEALDHLCSSIHMICDRGVSYLQAAQIVASWIRPVTCRPSGQPSNQACNGNRKGGKPRAPAPALPQTRAGSANMHNLLRTQWPRQPPTSRAHPNTGELGMPATRMTDI